MSMDSIIMEVVNVPQDAPPAYESVVGPSSFGVNCVDFWPKCISEHHAETKVKYASFEDFDNLVDRANKWLQKNPSFQVMCCETAEKKVTLTREIYSGSLQFYAVGSSATKIKGLRLWYKPSTAGSWAPPQYLGFRDFVPHMQDPNDLRCPDFENFCILLDRTNALLQQQPLQGQIISIDTVALSIANQIWDGTVNTLISNWPDTYKYHKLYFLRVFYAIGPPTNEAIGIADFVPEQIGETSAFHPTPHYTDLSSVLEKASVWTQEAMQAGVRVTNLQTLDTRYWRLSEKGSRLDTMGSFDYNVEERHRIYYLRVAYTKPSTAEGATSPPSYPYGVLSHRTFVPAMLAASDGCCTCRSKSAHLLCEDLFTTLERIHAWLKASGASVLNAEIVTLPQHMVQSYYEDMPAAMFGEQSALYDDALAVMFEEQSEICNNADGTVMRGQWLIDNSNKSGGPLRYSLVQVIRVYMVGKYREPTAAELPTLPPLHTDCCAIL